MNREQIPYDVGFIGTGNMGSALAMAVSRTGANIIISDEDEEKADAVVEKLGGVDVGTSKMVAEKSKFIFLCVRPDDLDDTLHELSASLNVRTDPFIIVSIVGGAAIEYITSLLGRPYPVIRVMPSSTCKVGSGTILYSCSQDMTMYDKNAFIEYMTFAGYLHEIDEKLMDPATAITGCGPVIAYMLLDALSDAGMLIGMSKKDALQYSYEMLIGAARMVEVTDKSPSELKDDDCTPAGVCVEVVRKLHEKLFSSAIIEAIAVANDKIGKTAKKY